MRNFARCAVGHLPLGICASPSFSPAPGPAPCPCPVLPPAPALIGKLLMVGWLMVGLYAKCPGKVSLYTQTFYESIYRRYTKHVLGDSQVHGHDRRALAFACRVGRTSRNCVSAPLHLFVGSEEKLQRRKRYRNVPFPAWHWPKRYLMVSERSPLLQLPKNMLSTCSSNGTSPLAKCLMFRTGVGVTGGYCFRDMSTIGG